MGCQTWSRPPPPPRRASAPAPAAAVTASGSATKKKRNRQRVQKLSPPEKNEEFAPGRTNYNPDETIILARCWIDISKDPVFAINQKQIAYWERIAERYNEAKPPAAYKRHREQLCKHWDQVKRDVNLFSAEYEKCLREQGSGKSLTNVRDRALASYISLYGDFKNYNSWLLLKDKQKFQGGILPLSAAWKRTKNTTTGDYTSSESGAHPMDLNQPMFNF
ncbi:glutathione S-transferase T3-like [Salvia splendens]|uniref:glutathione S-transferase T3-like n=1 Tax=Salvia splendens TaxID=180675 RepID=UPI001C26B42F|nr:glutathione S-transferase T3-like [Salvia splendens]